MNTHARARGLLRALLRYCALSIVLYQPMGTANLRTSLGVPTKARGAAGGALAGAMGAQVQAHQLAVEAGPWGCLYLGENTSRLILVVYSHVLLDERHGILRIVRRQKTDRQRILGSPLSDWNQDRDCPLVEALQWHEADEMERVE